MKRDMSTHNIEAGPRKTLGTFQRKRKSQGPDARLLNLATYGSHISRFGNKKVAPDPERACGSCTARMVWVREHVDDAEASGMMAGHRMSGRLAVAVGAARRRWTGEFPYAGRGSQFPQYPNHDRVITRRKGDRAGSTVGSGSTDRPDGIGPGRIST